MLVEFSIEHLGNDIPCVYLCGGKIGFNAVIEQRKADGRDTFYRSFYSGRHGARIYYVDRMVCAVIDAAQADIRLAVQNFIHSELYTVYRSACTLICFNSVECLNCM